MRITDLEPRPFHRIAYLDAAKRGGVESRALQLLHARADALPAALDALVLAGDLQGVVRTYQPTPGTCLLGVELARALEDLAGAPPVPPLDRVGVLLAGDLYAAPGGDVRGASGDVREFWRALRARCRWVAGVAGNHDRFGTAEERAALEREPGIHLLDGDVVTLDGLRIGGVGEIIGDPQKPGRKHEDDFLAALETVVDEAPDLVVLHEGPKGASETQQGNEQITRALARTAVPLVVCGHVYWPEPLSARGPRAQTLNTDGRVILVTR